MELDSFRELDNNLNNDLNNEICNELYENIVTLYGIMGVKFFTRKQLLTSKFIIKTS